MQRPFFSQSPKRVGSGPGGPPISRAAARGTARGAPARTLSALGGGGLSAGGGVSGLLDSRVDIGISLPEFAHCGHGMFRKNNGQLLRMAGAELHTSECLCVPLTALGALRGRGPDVVSFLQGQLSNDVTRLTAERSLFAGYHNPQGRVIALLRLVQLAPDEVLAILPRELVAPVAQRLAKFVLRSRVKLADESAAWKLTGLSVSAAGAGGVAGGERSAGLAAVLGRLPASVDATAALAGSLAVRLASPAARWLLITPQSAAVPPALSQCAVGTEEAWRRLAIAAGEPEVGAATTEEFVAQMLNLDLLGAIALDKGCYTGQEVIARAHYRGRVKRRLQHFVTHTARMLRPGEAGELADGRLFKVVSAVPLAGGGCEFLAVAPLAAAAAEAAAAPAGAAAAARQARLDAEQLALPYSLPQ
jgi:tRNA-modifying protein YgfZ